MDHQKIVRYWWGTCHCIERLQWCRIGLWTSTDGSPANGRNKSRQTTQYEQHLTDDNSLVADVLRIPGPDGLFLDVHGSIEVGVQLGGQNTIPAPVAPSVALTPGISSHSRSATRWSCETS